MAVQSVIKILGDVVLLFPIAYYYNTGSEFTQGTWIVVVDDTNEVFEITCGIKKVNNYYQRVLFCYHFLFKKYSIRIQKLYLPFSSYYPLLNNDQHLLDSQTSESFGPKILVLSCWLENLVDAKSGSLR